MLVFALVAAACGDDGDDGGSSESDEPSDTSAAPQAGGTLKMATFIEPTGFDPLMVQSGVVGGIEAMAVFDTVVRWNSETREYEMRTAESVEPNDDFTVWTITLKDGITFTDGTPYDAEALKWALDRHRSGQQGAPACAELRACPRNAAASSGPMATVADTTVTDPLTVEVTMKTAWPGFPAMLAAEPGMVPSPTAMKAACPADASAPYRDCPFTLAPVGAGPFKLTQFLPKERIVLERNDDYWGDAPLLDGIEFVNFADAGGQRTSSSCVPVTSTWRSSASRASSPTRPRKGSTASRSCRPRATSC
jgi:peptide/nickel transport system substrate-binding protein